MQKSDVARMREQIDAEIEAMNLAMKGFAVVASHKVIQHHMTRLGGHAQRLIEAIGPEQAIPEIVEKMNGLQTREVRQEEQTDRSQEAP